MNTTDNKPNEHGNILVKGHIKIFDPVTNEVFHDKPNAINYENFSIALAQSISNSGKGTIFQMVFGNGGTRVDDTGIITYLTPNVIGTSAKLYHETFRKGVDSKLAVVDNSRNFMQVRHVPGAFYTDLLVSCLLDFNEPTNFDVEGNGILQSQEAFDNSVNSDGTFVFDELGLRAYDSSAPNKGPMLTHVIFHPVQKSLNRMIQIDYTIRIQALSPRAQ